MERVILITVTQSQDEQSPSPYTYPWNNLGTSEDNRQTDRG